MPDVDCVDVVVIGAGVSGVTTAKNCMELGLSPVVVEGRGVAGGLWHFDPDEYGVMSFTHINVSKHNYAFSDFPFADEVPDYPHHTHMNAYINSYVDHFNVRPHIRFNRHVASLAAAKGDSARDGARWILKCQSPTGAPAETLRARSVAIACGHHAKPQRPLWPGQAAFEQGGGRVLHSVDFNDAHDERLPLRGKRVLVVGIGNSAMDAACNATSVASSVAISTRSGAWVFPNYMFGHCTDHYACRAFFALPWKVGNAILEKILALQWGSPHAIGLNPKQRALSSQPSVSGTLVHHIRRGTIEMRPDIDHFEGSPAAGAGGGAGTVVFKDGSRARFDVVLQCTGYSISLPFLDSALRTDVLNDRNEPLLYKNVFSPAVGDSLGFIGFVQPASGGIITMSETQARWFALLQVRRLGRALPRGARLRQLPTAVGMRSTIEQELDQVRARYTGSRRHTIQRDPHVYNDDIAGFFGARPVWWHYTLSNPRLAWALLFSSCGAAQWRLCGPGAWDGAVQEVLKTPVTGMWNWTGKILLLATARFLWSWRRNPYVVLTLLIAFGARSRK